MANLEAVQVTTSGTVSDPISAGVSGDRVRPNVFVRVTNGGGADITVTMVTHTTVDGLAVDDREIVVPAAGSVVFKTSRTYVASDGWCDLTYSSATSVTLEVLR